MRTIATRLATAGTLLLVMADPARTYGTTVTWTASGATVNTRRWDIDTNWSATPAWDGTEDIYIGTDAMGSSPITMTVNGNRLLNRLDTKIDGDVNRRWELASGTPNPSTLTLLSGNLSWDANGFSNGRPIEFGTSSAVRFQIGNGITPVTDAVWNIVNGHATVAHFQLSEIIGIAGTHLTLQGNNSVTAFRSSDNYLGDMAYAIENIVSGQNKNRLTINASHALGKGKVTVSGTVVSHISFNQTTASEVTTHAMALHLEGNAAIVVGVFNDATRHYLATLQGNLSGTDAIVIGHQANMGVTGYPNGTLILAGADNTHSGTVTFSHGGKLQVDGTWSGAGNMNVTNGRLSGGGLIGMAEDKSITVGGTASLAYLAPGTVGSIATLSIGTPGNGNSVLLNRSSILHCDLSGATPGLSDRLDVRGTLQLNPSAADKELRITLVDGTDLKGSYTLATYDSRTGTFDRVYLDDVEIADPTAPNGVGGTHQLVYGATSLQLVAAPPGGTLVIFR